MKITQRFVAFMYTQVHREHGFGTRGTTAVVVCALVVVVVAIAAPLAG